MMLKSVTLTFTENPDLVLPASGITIFVGPNNSGKSLILKEIEQAFMVHPFPSGLRILKDYDVIWQTETAVLSYLEKFKPFEPLNLPIGNRAISRINPNGGRESTQISQHQLVTMANQANDKHWWATQYLRWGVLRLDGRSRFNLTNDQQGGDLLGPPQTVLSHLFQDDEARRKVRAWVADAFKLNFVIDPTNLGQLRIRLSPTPPLRDEQSLNLDARQYHSAALHIKDASDGVQAFTGIVTAVLSGEFHTILIDEPEAFLHPPLARKLGKHLGSLAAERGGSLMASTHSPDFLMGCVQASRNVRVVRLEYGDGKSRGKMVDPNELNALLKHPLMRNANVVSSLFYDGVVVTESDNDRVFYSEIYNRLAENSNDYPSILFVNAQNKQTIKEIIAPLRRFGVPAAAISDIDIVKDGGKTWADWLRAAQIPAALHGGYASQRASILSCFEKTGKDMKTDGGTAVLSADDRTAAEQLFTTMAEHGVFVVQRGELECWLSMLGVSGKKTDWAVAMLERLGGDPSDSDYVRPASGDVWDFMRNVVAWINNPGRKGLA